MTTTIFNQSLRVLSCDSCGAPVQGTLAGGQSRCSYCGVVNMLAPRDDNRDRQAAQHQPQMSEAQRFQRLREQDGKPLMPPPALMSLLDRGLLTPQNEPVAKQQWEQARREVAAGGSFGAAERLYFITMMLYGLLSEQRQDAKVRALLETSLNHLTEPRHRAVLHGMMARNAARLNDIAAAEHWLSLCDPLSDDIQIDSAYRLTAAYIATAKREYNKVLQLLGSQIDDVPIADNNDIVCGVLRANALEKVGQLDAAVQQLMSWMGKAGPGVQKVVAGNASLGLCFQSMQRASQQTQQIDANVIRTNTGFKFGCLFLPLFLGGFAIPAIIGASSAMFGSEVESIVTPVTIVGYLIGTVILLIIVLGKGARARTRLKQHGVRGTATLISMSETGTQVNDQPQMLLRLKVEAPGQPTFIAEHPEIIRHTQLHQMLPGAAFSVLFDPNDRTQFVFEQGE